MRLVKHKQTTYSKLCSRSSKRVALFSRGGRFFRLDTVYGDDGEVHVSFDLISGKPVHFAPSTEIRHIDGHKLRIELERISTII